MPTLLLASPTRACAWCSRLHVSGRWRSLPVALRLLGVAGQDELGLLTHDICEDCAARM
jgi:hypothetical protein